MTPTPDDVSVLEAKALVGNAEKAVLLADIAERRATAAWREAREAAQRATIEAAQLEIRRLTSTLYRVLFDEARPAAVALYELRCAVARRAGLAPPDVPDAAWVLPTRARERARHGRRARPPRRATQRRMTRDEVRERFRGVVARAITKADSQIAAHFARLRGGYIPESEGLAALARESKRRRKRLLPTSTPRRRKGAT
jgi:hypothetical protein